MSTADTITVNFTAINQKRYLFEADDGTIYHGDSIDGSDAEPLKFAVESDDIETANREVNFKVSPRPGAFPPVP